MKGKVIILGLGLLLGGSHAMAQYPQIKSEANEAYKKRVAELNEQSEAAWIEALKVVKEEAKQGRRRHRFLDEELAQVAELLLVGFRMFPKFGDRKSTRLNSSHVF